MSHSGLPFESMQVDHSSHTRQLLPKHVLNVLSGESPQSVVATQLFTFGSFGGGGGGSGGFFGKPTTDRLVVRRAQSLHADP